MPPVRLPGLLRQPLERPRWVLAVALALTLLLCAGLPRLRLELDGRALVPSAAHEVHADAGIRRLFDVREVLAVVVEARAGESVLRPEALSRVADLARALARIPGLEPGDVHSLASEPSERVRPGTLDFRAWLDPLPQTEAQCASLKRELDELGLYRGTLLSDDEPCSATAILVRLPAEADRGALCAAVRRVARSGTGPERIHVVGAPVAESQLGCHVLSDLARLLPLCAGAIALLYWLSFRRVAAVLLPLLEVLCCLAATFGLMGWCGTPIQLTTAVLPVVLVAAGVADEVHLFAACQARLEARPLEEVRSAVEHALAGVWRPILKTTLTSALGFASFVCAPLPAVRSFGMYLAAGLLLCLAWSLLVLPACLVLLPRASIARAARPERHKPRGGIARVARGLAFACVRARARTLLGAGLLLVLLPPCIARLRVQDSWVGAFAPESELARSTRTVDRLFGGTHTLQVCASLPQPGGDWLEPGRLELLGELERHLGSHSQDGVGAVVGPHGCLTTAHWVLRAHAPDSRTLPATRPAVQSLWQRYQSWRGGRELGLLFDPSLRCARIAVFLREADQERTQDLLEKLRDWEALHLAPHGIALSFGGDAAVSTATVAATVRTQSHSLAGALPAVALSVALLSRSLASGLLCLLPALLALLVSLAGMGLAGIPLGIATSLFAATTVGVGADHAIHLIEAWRAGVRAGHDSAGAALRAVLRTGGAIARGGLIVSLGFATLVGSQVPSNARLGGLLAMSLIAAVAASLLVLPALLSTLGPAPSTRAPFHAPQPGQGGAQMRQEPLRRGAVGDAGEVHGHVGVEREVQRLPVRA